MTVRVEAGCLYGCTLCCVGEMFRGRVPEPPEPLRQWSHFRSKQSGASQLYLTDLPTLVHLWVCCKWRRVIILCQVTVLPGPTGHYLQPSLQKVLSLPWAPEGEGQCSTPGHPRSPLPSY